MTFPKIIAIDGPAASGKSTLGKRLADELGYLFFDTGVMYRAVTWAALQEKVSTDNEAATSALAERILIDLRTPSVSDGRNCDILIDGEDVTWQIRLPEVEQKVSQVSAYKGVRQALTKQQRRIGKRGGVVMVGRDIGTVVMPEAELKIFLIASAEERARRRYLEQHDRGLSQSYEEILAAMRKRDEFDSTRTLAPLRPSDDAVILNTDQMDETQVLEAALRMINEVSKENPSQGSCDNGSE